MSSTDGNVLLCESCGYSLVGLASDAICPECGESVAISLPGGRPGSAWQRAKGARPAAWCRTNWGVLRRARVTFSQVRLGRPLGVGLMGLNALATPCLAIGLLVMVAFIKSRIEGDHAWWLYWSDVADLALRGGLATATCLAAWLVCVQVVGFVGVWCGWTRPWARAAAVCSHASAVWLVWGALVPALYGIAMASMHISLNSNYRVYAAIERVVNFGVVYASVPFCFVCYVWLIVLGTRRSLVPSALPAADSPGGGP